MIKKFGMVTVGITAGLLVAAPLASANEAHGSEGHHQDSGSCHFVGGTGEGSSGGDASGEIAGIGGAAVGGIGGNNVGNIADCSNFLNDNVNGNLVASQNKLGNGELPSVPQLPDLGDFGGLPTFPGLPSFSAPGFTAPSI